MALEWDPPSCFCSLLARLDGVRTLWGTPGCSQVMQASRNLSRRRYKWLASSMNYPPVSNPLGNSQAGVVRRTLACRNFGGRIEGLLPERIHERRQVE